MSLGFGCGTGTSNKVPLTTIMCDVNRKHPKRTRTFRQLSITESLRQAKTKSFKMTKPYLVSDVIYTIQNSDSDGETSLQDPKRTPALVVTVENASVSSASNKPPILTEISTKIVCPRNVSSDVCVDSDHLSLSAGTTPGARASIESLINNTDSPKGILPSRRVSKENMNTHYRQSSDTLPWKQRSVVRTVEIRKTNFPLPVNGDEQDSIKLDQQNPSDSKTSDSHVLLPKTSEIPNMSSDGRNLHSFEPPSQECSTKHVKLKSLKAKEGRQLQVPHLKELEKLFHSVISSKYLRSLLSSEETNVLGSFLDMEEDQQYLVMKLFIYQKCWYNLTKFCTKAQIHEGQEVYQIMQFLQEKGFIETDYRTQDVFELLKELDRPEIREIMQVLRITPNKGTKDELLTSLFNATRRQTTLTKKTLKDMVMDQIEIKLGFAFKIKEEIYNALYNIYTLATFTNRDFEDIQDYFRKLIHLKVVFPVAPVEDFEVFNTRKHFLDYTDALKLRKELDLTLTTRGLRKLSEIYNIAVVCYDRLLNMDPFNATQGHRNAPHLERFTAEHVYCSILSTCSEHLFTRRNGKPADVRVWLEYLIKQFSQSRKLGKWFHRLIWIHMKHLDQINYKMAAKLLIEALEVHGHSISERDRYALELLGGEIEKSKKHKIDQMQHDKIIQLTSKIIDCSKFPEIEIDSLCIRSEETGKKRVYITRVTQEMSASSVEGIALLHYAENGYPEGKHCEGDIIKALLMLYFWDVIYNPVTLVPGSFISKIQTAPLDCFTNYFYQNRKAAIDQRLIEIESEWTDDHLIRRGCTTWQEHAYELSAFGLIVNTIESAEVIEVLINVIGREVLAKIFKRLIQNLRENSSGLPDLFVWNVDQRTHKFVEVKGEGDRLAPNQILWLQYLRKSGACIEVCYVHSMGSKRRKLRQVPNDTAADNSRGNS